MSKNNKISPNFMQNSIRKNPQAPIVSHQVVQQQVTISNFPTADELNRLKQVNPNFPTLVLGLIEKQTNHRIEQENKINNSQIKITERGQMFGFVLSIAVIALCFAYLLMGEAKTGAWLMSATIVALAAVFVGSKSLMKKNNKRTDNPTTKNNK